MSNSRLFGLRHVLIAFLAFITVVCVTISVNMTFVKAEEGIVNGWAAYNGNGGTDRFPFIDDYSSFITATDLGDGYTELWMNDGNQDFVNEIPLDVTKPIVIEYNYRTDSAWAFFSFIDNEHDVATDARSLSGDEVHTATAAEHPEVGLVFGLGGSSSEIFGGNDQLMRYTPTGETIENKCGSARVEGEYTRLEIYFGKNSAEEGYIAADGVVVAKLNVTQDFFDSGKVIFKTSFWGGSTTLAAKVYNAKGISYAITTDVNTGMSVEIADKAVAGDTVDVALKVNEGYHVTSFGWKTASGTLTPFAKEGDFYEEGKYTFVMPQEAVVIVGTAEVYATTYEIQKDVGNGITISVPERSPEGAVVDVSLSIGEGYRVISLGWHGFDEIVKAFEKSGDYYTEGNYTFTMPAEKVTIVGESEALFEITTETDSAITASVEKWAGSGDTVAVALSIAPNYKVTSFGWKTAGGEVTPFALLSGETEYVAGEYSFVMPEGDVTIVGEVQGFETVPDDVTKSNASYAGWDTEHMIYSGIQYGPYTDAMIGAWVFEKSGGMTTFMIDHGSAIGNVNALDVSKPIYIDIAITAVDISGGHTADGWSFIYFADDWNTLREKSINLYTDNSAYKTTLGWEGRIDISKLANWGDGAYWANFNAAPLAEMANPWGIACNEDEPSAWMPTSFLNIEIYFGKTAEEGYLKMGVDGGEKVQIAKPVITQSDFINGDTFISFGSFFKTQAAVKVYQDASWVVDDANISEHATVTMITEDTSNLKTFDEVKFTITCDEGYGISKVTAGGVELKPDENGVYTHTCLFGVNSLIVETGAQIKVTVHVNGGSAVENFTSSVGAIIEPPVSTRAGYTLEWCSDEELNVPFDFTQPLNSDTSLYAKWTVITYKINYYDGANKIRDLSKNTYTVEDTFTLETPVKEGYKFEGWYTDSQFTNQVSEISGSTGDLTLYAKWSEETGGCGSSVSASLFGISIALFGAVGFACKKRKNSK